MNEEGNTRGTGRYVALDIHKHYCVIAGVDREGRVLLHPVRVEHADLEEWLKKNLRASDHVVLESTNTAWQKDKVLSAVEQFQLGLEMENRAHLEKQISRIGKEVAKMSHQTPWAQ